MEKAYCEAHGGNCEKIKALEQDVEQLKRDFKGFEKRAGEVEKESAISAEQIKMIFKILDEIKASISEISESIKHLQQKPAQRWEETIRTVIAVMVTAAMTYFISGGK